MKLNGVTENSVPHLPERYTVHICVHACVCVCTHVSVRVIGSQKKASDPWSWWSGSCETSNMGALWKGGEGSQQQGHFN